MQEALDAEHRRRFLHPLADLLPGRALRLERKGDVLLHGEVRVERVALEDHGDLAVARRQLVDHPPADDHVAGSLLLQAGDHAQQGGFAGTRWPQEDEELAFPGHQINVVDRPQLALLEDFRQTPGFDNRHRRSG